MRIVLLVSVLCLGPGLVARAAEPLAPIRRQLYTCQPVAAGVFRIAESGGVPERCCVPQSSCAEYLSTNTIDHPSRGKRT